MKHLLNKLILKIYIKCQDYLLENTSFLDYSGVDCDFIDLIGGTDGEL